MKDDINSDHVSSLIDGEITESKMKEEISNKIERDKKLKFEFLTLKLLKRTIREKVPAAELSVEKKDEIFNKIGPEQKHFNLLRKFSLIRNKQFAAFSTFAVIFIAFTLLLLNGPVLNSDSNIVLEGNKSQNMFIQAVDNFQNIISGKMPIQMYSNDPKEIQEFFKANGVSYRTKISILDNAKLIGGMVSNFDGVKFAHHIYKDKNGNLLYMFQVDEKYLKEKPKLFITADLYQYLQNGNQYRLYLGNLLVIMTKVKNNICALISNIPEEELPEKYKLKFASTYYKQPSVLNN